MVSRPFFDVYIRDDQVKKIFNDQVMKELESASSPEEKSGLPIPDIETLIQLTSFKEHLCKEISLESIIRVRSEKQSGHAQPRRVFEVHGDKVDVETEGVKIKEYFSNNNIKTMGVIFNEKDTSKPIFKVYISPESICEYLKKKQINGLYFHKTLKQLFDILLLSLPKNYSYQAVFELAVSQLLGKFYCCPTEKGLFEIQRISLSVLENYISTELQLQKPKSDEVDVELLLQNRLFELAQSDRLLVKTVDADINDVKAQGNLTNTFNFLNNPQNNRTKQIFTIESDKRNKKFHPYLKIQYDNSAGKIKKRGSDKKNKLHTKHTSTTLGSSKSMDNESIL